MQPPGPGAKIALPNVKYLVAVASGKGGVGKSTVAVNLAVALRMQGHRVGLMDADIYGPSVPRMMGVPAVDPQNTAFPLERYGVKIMSMGFLVNPEQAVIWRGPMVHKAITQFLTDPHIEWGQLDYLIIDLPPGTGDAQLSLSQTAPLSGAIIVTMPQDVSLTVAQRGLAMFRQVRVPVLGVVENMSYLLVDGQRTAIFGQGGGQKLSTATGVPFLGEIPIDPRVAEGGDAGDPIVHKCPEAPAARAFLDLAARIVQELQQAGPSPELPGLAL